MQRKSVKTILFGLFLSIPATYTGAYAATDFGSAPNNVGSSTLSPIQPGFYYGVGITYASVRNAGMKNLSVHQLPFAPSGTDDPYMLYQDGYASGAGANAKISYLWPTHWGAEINMTFVKISKNQSIIGNTNLDNTPVSATYTRRTSNFFTEALGEYAFSLNPRLALLTKLGMGYEYQNQAFFLNGIVVTPDATHFTSTFQEKDHHFGPAAAAELRYALLSNVSLGFEVNDLAADENIIAANANVIVRF